jgi:class 3 adenylate cyclase
VKTTGDGFMAAFSSVTAAVECAIALQRAFADAGPAGVESLAIRLDLYAGEILVPEAVRHLVSGKGFRFTARGEAVLRGLEDAIRVHEVLWRED